MGVMFKTLLDIFANAIPTQVTAFRNEVAVLRKTRSVSFSPKLEKGKNLPGSREEGLANKRRASQDRVEFWLPSYEYFQHFAEILNWRSPIS